MLGENSSAWLFLLSHSLLLADLKSDVLIQAVNLLHLCIVSVHCISKSLMYQMTVNCARERQESSFELPTTVVCFFYSPLNLKVKSGSKQLKYYSKSSLHLRTAFHAREGSDVLMKTVFCEHKNLRSVTKM